MAVWEPMYIRQVIDRKPRDHITHMDWNSLWNLVIVQGDNNAEGVLGMYRVTSNLAERMDVLDDFYSLTNLEIDELMEG